jgi:hypothetical protein
MHMQYVLMQMQYVLMHMQYTVERLTLLATHMYISRYRYKFQYAENFENRFEKACWVFGKHSVFSFVNLCTHMKLH